MQKTLDTKLAKILADPSCGEFILADAKDADMAGGMAAPGKSPEHHAHEGKFRTLQQYRNLIRENIEQGLIDIMLMSASSNEVLTIKERLFDASHVTPAIRANDTTDIWLAHGGQYTEQPARMFRTATIDHGMCGKTDCQPDERRLGADLGLFSVTFNNDVSLDRQMLEEYRAFRVEAEAKGFRHFLEVFDPNALQSPVPDSGRFLNDNVARALAGVATPGRPLFLKVPYHGPAAMEQLVSYDRSMIVGILGGSSGTTFDAFHQLWEARKYGARVALYGRMINNSEHQGTFIQHLRWLADGQIDDPSEAVRSYHSHLAKLHIRPYRPLQDDLRNSARASAYSGAPGAINSAQPADAAESRGGNLAGATEEPEFSKMTQAEKNAWNMERWNRILE